MWNGYLLHIKVWGTATWKWITFSCCLCSVFEIKKTNKQTGTHSHMERNIWIGCKEGWNHLSCMCVRKECEVSVGIKSRVGDRKVYEPHLVRRSRTSSFTHRICQIQARVNEWDREPSCNPLFFPMAFLQMPGLACHSPLGMIGVIIMKRRLKGPSFSRCSESLPPGFGGECILSLPRAKK